MSEPKNIEITVNNNTVVFTEKKQTGLQIKQAAITQGVKIQLDFALFIERGGSPLKPVADGESVELENKEKFKAVAPDDTSHD